MAGRVITWWGFGWEREGGSDVVARLCRRASRVPGRKGRPQPRAEQDREERKGMGTGRAERRPGGSRQAGRAPGSPRAGCALQHPHGPGIRVGGDDVMLNLAQNKQPSVAGENRRLVFQADGEMVEPFSSGPAPDGR